MTYATLQEKWKPILSNEYLPEISDNHRKAVTATVLENTERELRLSALASHGNFTSTMLSEASPTNSMGASSSTASDGNIDIFDPVLISLVRRSMPNLIAYDICGVQPMNGPTGLIFAMRARYANQEGTEAFYNEPNTAFGTITAGANTLGDKHVGGFPGNTTTGTANLAETGIYNFGDGMATTTQEALGSNSTLIFPEMAFSIEKVTVTAKGRALKAEYSLELAQDLKAIHGLDAEGELSNILSAELLAEINREVVRTIALTALKGAVTGTTTAGRFDLDTDSNGRWSVEKFKGLMAHIEFEANEVAKATRRGKANIVICSSNVASALQMAGVLDYTPALNSNNLNVDDTGATFAGVLNGRFRVYIDPYATGNYLVVGYKGANAFDAGLFYCPYVPLQMVRAVDPNTFQPKIGFKTRYGMVSNPFSKVTYSNGLYTPVAGAGALEVDANAYYRRVLIDNIM
jgi:Major capsid protein Gp23